MPMGRERGVLRWDIRATLLADQLAEVERELGNTPEAAPKAQERRERLEQERLELLSALRALGPSPRAKMG